jgi:pre-mRNA-processing factor 17
MDSSDIEGYTGPWAQYENESKSAKPTPEEAAEIEAFMAKKKKYGKKTEEKEFEEKSTIHIDDVYDYQGRSFLHTPHDLDINLKADHFPSKCFLPKKVIHTYTGHSKALTAIRWFPRSAHLFLSSGMDSKIKLWEVYKERRCVITYLGHKQAVRDINFNRKGTHFSSIHSFEIHSIYYFIFEL